MHVIYDFTYDFCMWYMIMVYDGFMQFMILIYDGWVWANLMWYVYTWWFGQRCGFDLLWQEANIIANVPCWQATNEVWFEVISIYFKYNGNYYVLGTGKHEMLGWVVKTNGKH